MKKYKPKQKEKPIVISIAGCKLLLYPSIIKEILNHKQIDMSDCENMLLDKKIKFIKEHITIDDLSHYHLHLSK